jgi:demethylmenaquinone methyltransferase / 2-methoxy-6-polyprenyl-1,4-benzoquinol methylase
MANPFYSPDEQRAAKVRDLFAAIAPRYDLLNNLQSFGLHLFWKRKLVEVARIKQGETALDVCCGTGDIAIALARSGARAVGLDFTPQMLAMAETRVKKELLKMTDHSLSPGSSQNPQFFCGDAERIPFSDNTFEVVTTGYGLRNLASWETGLKEMYRIAKPGGRLLVLEFGKPDNAIWRMLYFTYLKMFVPLLGLIFCGNAAAYAYILESLKHYPAQNGVARKMKELGLTDVRIFNLVGGAMSINYGVKSGNQESRPGQCDFR